jgi:hypothetical protein
VEVEASMMARHFTEEDVGAFEHEGQTIEVMLEEVVEAAAKEASRSRCARSTTSPACMCYFSQTKIYLS